MEIIQDYLNKKVISLVKQIAICEEERKATLLEIITFENTANNSGSGGMVPEMCKTLKKVLENLVVIVGVEKMDNGEIEEKHRRKCRYFNRGYCKYKENCKYYHSPNICEEYQENGICAKDRCWYRHPKHCRNWSRNPEGCRYKSCEYLHVNSEKYSHANQQEDISIVDNAENCESTDDSSLRIHHKSPHDISGESWCPGDQCGEGGASEKRVMWHDNEDFISGSVLSGDECDLYQKSRDSLQSHRRTDHETTQHGETWGAVLGRHKLRFY